VSIAVEGERPRPGHVYFSAQRLHLEIGTDGRLHHSAAAPLDGHRPSVTVTFRSVARAFPGACAVVLLTGMGSDGLEGMREVQACGGVTIAQDEASCVVYGMSKTAIDQGLARHIEPLGSIAERLQEVVGSHGKR
jgi:two-component system chemotaxis response regulator CheB